MGKRGKAVVADEAWPTEGLVEQLQVSTEASAWLLQQLLPNMLEVGQELEAERAGLRGSARAA